MDSKGSNEEDEQAIALTEISWENSMRNDENPRTHEEVVRTETSVTVQKRTTQQSNPLFSSLQQDGEAEATATMEAELGPVGSDATTRSPPKLNPIFSGEASAGGEADVEAGKRGSTVRVNALAEDDGEGGGGGGDPEALAAGSKEEESFSMRTKCRDFVYSVYVQTFIIILLFLDVALLITEVFVDRGDTKATERDKLNVHKAVDICTALIVIILTFEICLRILADTAKVFFSKKMNWFDFIITIGSVALVMADLDYTGALLAGRSVRVASHLRLIQRARLATHSLRVITRSLGVTASAKVAARNRVGTNKKRFQKEGFDLDLCYITKDVIAMSVPAVDNILKLYRNPIEEVERFFRLKHTEMRVDGRGLAGMYQIHNLCPELPYADSYFHQSGGEIVRFNVQDHTPPSMNQLVDLCRSTHEFFQRKSAESQAARKGERSKAVVAVHCRGGKGRTGTAVVAWLLYSKQQPNSDVAMDFFAKKRTELTKKGKLQGIETPSQKRYVKYFEHHLNSNWDWRNSKSLPPLGFLPYVPDVYISLRHLKAPTCFETNPYRSPDAKAGEKPEKIPKTVYCVVDTKNQDFLKVTGETPVREDGSFEIDLSQDGGCRVQGDVRVRVFGLPEGVRAPTIGEITSKILVTKAGKEQGLHFFFWFHTAFAGDMIGAPVTLGLADLDKAWKNKKGLFRQTTSVQLHFDRA